ncbi:hypothetical protein IP69_20690 [Bosea sp. AAP35]|uniref:hypothetical protein n=1 Tax=Bosea sp. AAP35 TaxID=1523417 RepID=UPI0006B8A040|nr:hypothetical protein [Bosea sp. AAP35]KPF62401.1 hypothetical protein IP69_20690 [Bosea sp. AAP35]
MSWPKPVPGLVIRYAYLWKRQAADGQEESVKDRPAAVVLAIADASGRSRVYALPITHSPPLDVNDAVEIPPVTKRRLGLDGERSWIMLTEANVFLWPGPDLRVVPGSEPSSPTYGMLPPAMLRETTKRFLERARRNRLRLVPRTD